MRFLVLEVGEWMKANGKINLDTSLHWISPISNEICKDKHEQIECLGEFGWCYNRTSADDAWEGIGNQILLKLKDAATCNKSTAAARQHTFHLIDCCLSHVTSSEFTPAEINGKQLIVTHSASKSGAMEMQKQWQFSNSFTLGFPCDCRTQKDWSKEFLLTECSPPNTCNVNVRNLSSCSFNGGIISSFD